MSFEADTTDVVLRQLKEEIAKIREEQIVATLPTNSIGSPSLVNSDSGIGAPDIGVTSIIPAVVAITKDTGVIDLLNFDGKNPNKDFTIGETITGQMSGATATVGDIDTLTDTTGVLTLVPSSITGTFNNNENLNGSGAGGNNIADADGSQFTQTGRGHLNAGAGSIIADSKNISSPFEIHFIDNSAQDGQTVYLRAQNGQTIRMRRAVTNDGNTGNLDLDQSFDIIENAIVFLQFQVASNVSTDGGWVPQISNVSAGTGTGAGAFTFPILYPKENLGTKNGVIELFLNQSDGHYKQITLDGDASLTFSNLPPSVNGFKFYVLTIQDGVGGHVYTDLPDSVLFEGSLLGQLQTGANAQTLWQFSTADGGLNWHASVINPQGAVGSNQTPWLQPVDASTFDLFNADKIIFFGAGGFSFPTDASLQAISTSGTALQFNVGVSQTYRFFRAGIENFQIGDPSTGIGDLRFFDNNLRDVSSIFFTDSGSFTGAIFSNPAFAELTYNVGGVGSHHSFFANNITGNASFEIREEVNKSNVNFDLVTNNMINTDQILFIDNQGFNNATDHGERRLTGGDLGISMNLPVGSPFANAFAIWFEEDDLTRSNTYYQFTREALILGTGVGDCTRAPLVTGADGYQLCLGGGLFEGFSRTILRSSTVSLTPSVEQILELNVAGTTKIEMTNLASGIKMFDDVDMSTFNIFDLDVLRYAVDSGVIGANIYGSAVESDGSRLKWSVPPTRGYEWQVDLERVADLTANRFRMASSLQVTNPSIISDGSFILGLTHSLGSVGMINGEHRLVDDGSGSLDVIFGTGNKLVNLSDLTAGGLDIDNDLGIVTSGVVGIDWDVSNFHRMVVGGNVSIIMDNLPLSGEWQEITVEFLQDSNGGHEVTFVDIFQNSVVPRISKGTNRYTTVRFYSYNDGTDRILAFETVRNPEIPPFYQGIILARMSVDQTANTAVGNRLEFDTALFFDRLGVSVGGGQQKGIFSGFVKGRTYECTCHFAVENSTASNPATMGVQWFDIAQSLLIGTRGTATDVDISDPNLHTAIAYFIPNADTDTLEVRITQNFGNADTVISGFSSLPMSQVTIKDCGISEAEFNTIIDEIRDEDFPEIPSNANPPMGFNVNSTLYNNYQSSSLSANENPWTVGVSGTPALPIIDAEVVLPFVRPGVQQQTYVTEGLDPTIGQNDGAFVSGAFGFIKRVRLETTGNTLNKSFIVSIVRDGVDKVVLFTIGAGINTSVLSGGNTPIDVGHSYAFHLQTTDGQIPFGSINISTSVEIEWGIAP